LRALTNELGEIHRLRSEVLSAWVASCTVALDVAIHATSPCNTTMCPAMKVGVLVMGLQAAGFHPSPSSPNLLPRSVLDYWKDLKAIGTKYSTYSPCDKTSHTRGVHTGVCSSGNCFGGFGVKTAVRATLKHHAHKHIWKQWLKVSGELQQVVHMANAS
jgi:hypothetical protein